ncbi:hypothetical protein GCM10010306_098680 [Streptomyces umbrinus]|nr:hypothetical protein GCM10010306_098680 [Streptomyces umbrinus]
MDANTAYTLADAEHPRRLDEFGLLLIEEPLEENNLHANALLQRRIATPSVWTSRCTTPAAPPPPSPRTPAGS